VQRPGVTSKTIDFELIESGEINPNTTDGTALYNYTVTYFNGFQGEEGSATSFDYLFDGTIKGTRKRSAAQGLFER
jgi:hypothetical protein